MENNCKDIYDIYCLEFNKIYRLLLEITCCKYGINYIMK